MKIGDLITRTRPVDSGCAATMRMDGMRVPKMGESFQLRAFINGALDIKGLAIPETHDGWKAKFWKKVDPISKGESTAASQSLVRTLHIEKIGTQKDKYLEEERELITDAEI